MDPLRRLSAAERFARARELRHNPTPAEHHAWTLLRNRGILGLKFRRDNTFCTALLWISIAPVNGL